MKYCTLLVLFVLSASSALPFGREGHQTVAAIAAPLLTPATQDAIKAILGSETLLQAATWPDDIKKDFGSLRNTQAARNFRRDHPHHDEWHYVNFPVGAEKYTASSKFARPDDVVHMINLCIKTLEGEDSLPEDLSKPEALRYLAHLVGDIHQPLHVVAGYYDLSDPAHPKLEQDPKDILFDTSDHGGVNLQHGTDSVHFIWDTVLVNDIFDTSDPEVLATQVMGGAPLPATFKTGGKYTTWAAKWAADSMKVAKIAYADLQFGAVTTQGGISKIAVTLLPSDDAYRTKNKETVKQQLRKAGVHLAQLLNAIQWEDAP